MKIIRVYYFQLWHYLPFKVSPSEKLTSICTSSFLTSSSTSSQISHYPIHITSLLYIFLVILPFWNPFPLSYLTFLASLLLHSSSFQIHPLLLLHFPSPSLFPRYCTLPWTSSSILSTSPFPLLFFYLRSFLLPTLCYSNHLSQWQIIAQASKSQSEYIVGSLQENSTRSLFLIRVLFIQSPHGPCY